MTTLIIDIADDPTPKLAALKASGVRTIFGYLSSISPTGGKCWTPARMRAIAVAGLRAGFVHEGWGGVGGRGISAGDGARDGRIAAPPATHWERPAAHAFISPATGILPRRRFRRASSHTSRRSAPNSPTAFIVSACMARAPFALRSSRLGSPT
jgi:hypothetical protein